MKGLELTEEVKTKDDDIGRLTNDSKGSEMKVLELRKQLNTKGDEIVKPTKRERTY
jgi:hypothetical protein